MDHNKLWEILKDTGIPSHLTFLLRNLYAGKEATDMEKWTVSKLGNEYIKAVYCHPTYLTYMQSTSEAFMIAQLVKNPPAMQETLVRFLGQEDLLEKG